MIRSSLCSTIKRAHFTLWGVGTKLTFSKQKTLHHNLQIFSSFGTMLEAEIVSPMEKDLKDALFKHKYWVCGGEMPKIQKSLEKIRRFQYELGKWEDALKTEKELHVEHYESSLEMAQSHNRLAVLYQNLENHRQSRSHFEASLRYFQQEVHPPNIFHAEIGEACNHLAAVAAKELELEAAMHWLKRSEPHFRHHGKNMFEISDEEEDEDDQKKKKEPPHPELRKCLENQGQILRLMNRHEEALEIYREIEENLLLDDNKEADEDLKLDLADCLLTLKRTDEAEELYVSVLENLEVDLEESLKGAAIHHQLGLIEADTSNVLGDGDRALMHFDIALQIRKRLLGDTHLNVGKTLMAMGVVRHVLLGDPASAISDLRQALIIYRSNSEFENNEDDPEVKKILKNISLIQKDTSKTTFQK